MCPELLTLRVGETQIGKKRSWIDCESAKIGIANAGKICRGNAGEIIQSIQAALRTQ